MDLSNLELFYFLLIFLTLLAAFHVSRSSRWSWFPEASVIMLGGVATAALVHVWYTAFTVSFSPDLFFLLLLPPIIFKSGFEINLHYFCKNFLTVMVYANVGTLINIVAVCWVMVLVGQMGLSNALTPAEGMSFGAVVSATDPVTTIAVFERLAVEQQLYVIVVGVSVLDDAVSVLVFDLCNAFVRGEAVSGGDVAMAMGLFVVKLSGSMALGTALGVGWVYLLKKAYPAICQHSSLLASLFVAFVYISYTAADVLQISGIISTMFAALAAQRYLAIALPTVLVTLRGLCAAWASALEGLLFFYMGMAFTNHLPKDPVAWGFVLWSILGCLLGRVAQVYPLAWIINATCQTGISPPQQHMLTLAGLRGPIAFATSLLFPQSSQGDNRDVVAAASAITVFSTTTVLGAITMPALRALQVPHGHTSTHGEATEPSPEQLVIGSLWAQAWDQRILRMLSDTPPPAVVPVVMFSTLHAVDEEAQISPKQSKKKKGGWSLLQSEDELR